MTTKQRTFYEIANGRTLLCDDCGERVEELDLAYMLECSACGAESYPWEAENRRCYECGKFMARGFTVVHETNDCGNGSFSWVIETESPAGEELAEIIHYGEQQRRQFRKRYKIA